jgi:hypothetical protein
MSLTETNAARRKAAKDAARLRALRARYPLNGDLTAEQLAAFHRDLKAKCQCAKRAA